MKKFINIGDNIIATDDIKKIYKTTDLFSKKPMITVECMSNAFGITFDRVEERNIEFDRLSKLLVV